MEGGHEQLDPRTLAPASRLRAAADGEIPPSPPASREDASRIAFERGLRASCRRVMDSGAAPQDVRARVTAAIKDAPFDTLKLRGEPGPTHGVSHDGSGLGVLRQSRRLAWIAVAAMLAVVAGAGVAMRGVWMSGVPSSSVMFGVEKATILANFANEQHQQCADFGPAFEGKMKARTLAEAQKAAIELLSRVPEVLDLRSERLTRAGYTFAGLGPCHVPGKGRSAHLLYRPDQSIAPGAPVVSLFVQEDTGEFDLESMCAYRKQGDESKKRCCLTIWRDQGLIYYLITPKGTPREAREAFEVPAREQLL